MKCNAILSNEIKPQTRPYKTDLTSLLNFTHILQFSLSSLNCESMVFLSNLFLKPDCGLTGLVRGVTPGGSYFELTLTKAQWERQSRCCVQPLQTDWSNFHWQSCQRNYSLLSRDGCWAGRRGPPMMLSAPLINSLNFRNYQKTNKQALYWEHIRQYSKQAKMGLFTYLKGQFPPK